MPAHTFFQNYDGSLAWWEVGGIAMLAPSTTEWFEIEGKFWFSEYGCIRTSFPLIWSDLGRIEGSRLPYDGFDLLMMRNRHARYEENRLVKTVMEHDGNDRYPWPFALTVWTEALDTQVPTLERTLIAECRGNYNRKGMPVAPGEKVCFELAKNEDLELFFGANREQRQQARETIRTGQPFLFRSDTGIFVVRTSRWEVTFSEQMGYRFGSAGVAYGVFTHDTFVCICPMVDPKHYGHDSLRITPGEKRVFSYTMSVRILG